MPHIHIKRKKCLFKSNASHEMKWKFCAQNFNQASSVSTSYEIYSHPNNPGFITHWKIDTRKNQPECKKSDRVERSKILLQEPNLHQQKMSRTKISIGELLNHE